MKRNIAKMFVGLMVLMMLFVSCSNDVNTDKVRTVNFEVETGAATRSISPTPQVMDPADFYWYYTAVKKDNSGFTTGQQLEPVPVLDGKGLGSVGPFSLGDWEFTLYALKSTYGEFSSNVAYGGKVRISIGSGTNKVGVIVSNVDVPENTGVVRINKNYLIENGNGVFEGDSYDIEIEFYKDDVLIPTPSYLKGKTGYLGYSLAPGDYTAKVMYVTRTDAKEVLASSWAAFTVHSNVDTFVEGTLVENNTQVELDATLSVQNVEVTHTVETGKDATIVVDAAPESADKVNNKTEISIPDGGLDAGDAKVAVTTYASKAATEKSDFKVENGQAAVGGIDITITQNSSEKTDFTDHPILVTTYIAPGFASEDLVVKCSDETQAAPELVSYDPITGKLQFSTNHLSSFYVALTGYQAFNVTKGYYIKSFDDQFNPKKDIYNKWERGDEFRLLDNIECNDETGGFGIFRRSLTIDLNGKTITTVFSKPAEDKNLITVFGMTSGVDFTLKDSVGSGKIVLNENTRALLYGNLSSSVTFDGVEIESKTTIVRNDNSNRSTLTVNVKNGSKITVNAPEKHPLFVNSVAGFESIMNVNIVDSTIIANGVPVFQNHGNNKVGKDTLTVSGSSDITGQLAYIPNGCNVQILDGTFRHDATILYIKAGNLDIQGGNFIVETSAEKKYDRSWIFNGSGANYSSDAIMVEACNYGGNGDPYVNVKGGIFTVPEGSHAITLLNHNDPDDIHTVKMNNISPEQGSVASYFVKRTGAFNLNDNTETVYVDFANIGPTYQYGAMNFGLRFDKETSVVATSTPIQKFDGEHYVKEIVDTFMKCTADAESKGFKIERIGDTGMKITRVDGSPVVAEYWRVFGLGGAGRNPSKAHPVMRIAEIVK